MSKYTPEITVEICGYLESGLNQKDACILSGIGTSTFHEWLEKHAEFSEAISLVCNNVRVKVQQDYLSEKATKCRGHVYIIHCTETSYYKIGVSKRSPKERIGQLQVGCPYRLEFYDIFDVVDYRGAEAYLHYKYRLNRKNGEWFKLSACELNAIGEFLQGMNVYNTQNTLIL